MRPEILVAEHPETERGSIRTGLGQTGHPTKKMQEVPEEGPTIRPVPSKPVRTCESGVVEKMVDAMELTRI